MKKFLLVLFSFLAALAIAVPARADLVLVTNRADLGADTTVDWGSLGSPDTEVPIGTTVGSITISMPTGAFLRLDQDVTGWDGNFAPSDHLLWTNSESGPMQIVFTSPIYGAGTQIQPQYIGSFVAWAEVFSGSTFLGSFSLAGNSTYAGDGSAIFLGVLSSIAFNRIDFSIDNPTGKDFAINALGIRTNPVPLPPSALLLGSALLPLGVWIRRRNRK